MASILGRPFLEYLLAYLAGQGLRKVRLCTGYCADVIEAHFGERFGPMELSYSREPEPLGTAGALARALPQGVRDPLLVLNGDSFIDADLRALFAWYQEHEIENAMVLAPVPEMSRFGGVEFDHAGRISAFLEKGRRGPGLVNAGIYLLHPACLHGLSGDRPASLEQDVFPNLAGHALHGFPCREALLDIGTPESLRAAEGFFTRQEEKG
jgi:NDP-sugar pyrophosphorylase family protein